MLVATLFVQLTLWVAGSHAFFPWIPEYLCEEDKSCQTKSQRRESDGGTVTFPLSQREPDALEPRADRVLRAARYLSAKYSRTNPALGSRVDDDKAAGFLEKRQNNKYTVSKAANPTTPDSAGLHQDGSDLSYFIDVGLGSGSKSIYMLLDTGAGTTWAMGSTCKSAACLAHNSFGPGDSTSFKSTDKTFSIAYGTGTVSGTLASDSFSIAGKKVAMSFGVANVTSDDFNHFPFDGILGMSMSSGATDNLPQVLKREKVFKANLFGVYVGRTADGPNTGEVSFGGTNPAKYTGDFTYMAVSDKASGDWAISLDDFAYDGAKAGLSGRLGYIDTGTTYIFGPAADVAAVHKQIPGAKSADGGTTYTAPCDSKKPLTVSFGGVAFTIQTRDWLSGPNANGDCVSNLYGHEVVRGAWLMGDVFLKNVYAVFDMDKMRIGFASRAPVPTPVSTPAAPSTPAANGGGSSSTAPNTQGPSNPNPNPASSSPFTLLPPSQTTAAAGGSTGQPGTGQSQQPAGSSPAPAPKESSSKPTSLAGSVRVDGLVLAVVSATLAAIAIA